MVLKDQYRLLGENVAKLKTDLMKEQLEEFARKHKVQREVSDAIMKENVLCCATCLLLSFLLEMDEIDCFC
ncbi:hypothetical protein DKX38_017892 [Salix brachista]|uniref:Uncharacterized protein n=1 Tax=Salix brachista TaxID=2182728 RepID=A0A5N5KXR1_9ROSI|nr:hypothetical protein DKX38_017892 [Salix brachista]